MSKINLSGKKFHRLTVIKFSNIPNTKKPMWWCLCDCGNGVLINSYNILSGNTKSCGCLKNETFRYMIKTSNPKCYKKYVSGEKDTVEYQTWEAIKTRCNNKNAANYEYYGGRGIQVCERWTNSYLNFLADMGRRPIDKHSLDRIRVNENYGPDNCRWATWTEQANNRRKRNSCNLLPTPL